MRKQFEVIVALTESGRHDLAEIVAGLDPVADLGKSLNTLVKYNEGLWKSPKQGKFLHQLARQNNLSTSEAMKWAKGTGRYDTRDRNAQAISLIQVDPRFGKRTQSKIRYYGQFFLIDGQGVVARAAVKVDHATQKAKVETAKTTFLREAQGESVDPMGEAEEKERQRKAQIPKNKDLIERIKTIPRWDQQLFKDFVETLERGYTLSPKQMAIVDRELPTPIVDVDLHQALKDLAGLDKVVEKVVDHLVGIHKGWEVEEQAAWDAADEQQRRWKTPPKAISGDLARTWAKYKAGTFEDPLNYLWTSLEGVLQGLGGFNWTRRVGFQQPYYVFREQLNRAAPKLKRGKAPTKKALNVLRTLHYVYDRLKTATITEDAVRRAM